MRRRLAAFAATLFSVGAVFLIVPTAANAAGPCTTSSLSSQGYSPVKTAYPYSISGQANDANLVVWYNSVNHYKLVRFGNLRADGKANLAAYAGTSSGSTNLGYSNSIGTAPSGGFCSNTTTGAIYGYITYTVNGFTVAGPIND